VNQPVNWSMVATYASGAWAVVGPLVGVLVGAWLSRSWDKQKWMNDNRKEECRELLTAVTDAATAVLDRDVGTDGVSLAAKMDRANKAYLTSLKVFQDRIFIADDIERTQLFDIWPIAVNRYNSTRNRHDFDNSFEHIKKKIVQIATGKAL
jgi:hypothetical protein